MDDALYADLAQRLSQAEHELRARQAALRAELAGVDRDLARAVAVRLALTGEPATPPPTSESPSSYRRRTAVVKERQDRVMAWSQTHGGWWTLAELGQAWDTSVQRLSPTVGRMVERGLLERWDTATPKYRHRQP